MSERKYITFKELVDNVEKTQDSNQIGMKEWIAEVKHKPETWTLRDLILPHYVMDLSLGEKLYILQSFTRDLALGQDAIPGSAKSHFGEIGFEILLTGNRRLFNPKVFRTGGTGTRCFNTLDEVKEVLKEHGDVDVQSLVFDTETGEHTKSYLGVLKLEDIEKINFVVIANTYGSLAQTLTASEASNLWGLERSTIRKAIVRGRFKYGGFRRSGGTWLVTYHAMQRAFGAVPGGIVADDTVGSKDGSHSELIGTPINGLLDEIDRHDVLGLRAP